MRKIMSLVKITGAAGLFILAGACKAGCTVSSPITATADGIPTTISVSSSLAVGSPIGNALTIPNTTSAGGILCSGGTTWSLLRLNPNWTPSGIPDIYNTSMPGIGVKIREEWSLATMVSALTTSLQIWYSPGNNWGWPSSNGWGYLTGIKIQYYVTGPITPGVYSSETMVEAWMNNIIDTSGGAKYIDLMSPIITVKTLTCETPDIKVDLEKHSTSEFASINSTSTAKQFNFEIKNCDPELNSVNYTFRPAAGTTLENSGTVNQYLTLSSDSDATGVGIQVLYDDGTIVPFNSKIKYTGYRSALGGDYIIPMKARYIKTASTMTGGTANSAVEFTMSYE